MLKKLVLYNLVTMNWCLRNELKKENKNVLNVVSCCGITSKRDKCVAPKYEKYDWKINLQYWKGRCKLLC